MPWPARLLPLRRTVPNFLSRYAPNKPTPLSHSSRSLCASSSHTAPARPPPRKGRQATRRLLKLLSPHRQDRGRPDLSGALDALEADPYALSPSQAAALVSAVADPLLSYDFYRFLRCAGGDSFRPDASLFSSLLASQLGSLSPHPFRIRLYLRQMRRYGARLSHEEFHSLFGSLFPHRPALARSFLDEVVEVLGPDSATFAAAVKVYAEIGLVEEALRVAERGRAEIEGPHAVEFYSSLMGLYRINGDARAAMEAFMEMEERGVAADEGIYRTLLEILCGFGWMKLCWVILEEMIRRRSFMLHESLGLDLMRAFLKRDMVHEAAWLFGVGILKERESYSLFAESVAEKKMPLVAFEVLKTAGQLESCAAFLIQGCGKVGLIEEAEKVFGVTISSESIEVKRSLLSSMIHVYSRAGLRSSAEIVWKQLEDSGSLTGEACLCMMSMYGEMGLFAYVEKMFDQWKCSGFPVNVDGYVVVINALIKAGKLNPARDCLLEMRKSGIKPTCSIYLNLMDGFLKAGLLNHATVLLDECMLLGFIVDDGSMASSIIQVLVQTGRYSELRFYLDSFRKSGIEIPKEKGLSLMEICREDSCSTKIAQLVR